MKVVALPANAWRCYFTARGHRGRSAGTGCSATSATCRCTGSTSNRRRSRQCCGRNCNWVPKCRYHFAPPPRRHRLAELLRTRRRLVWSPTRCPMVRFAPLEQEFWFHIAAGPVCSHASHTQPIDSATNTLCMRQLSLVPLGFGSHHPLQSQPSQASDSQYTPTPQRRRDARQ